MSDCMNADIRDRLPDLVHDRLDGRERAEVAAHVAACAECRAEVELLRAARAMFVARTPTVDVARIVQALPAPRPASVRRRRLTDWRIAAAITVLAVGGGSIAVATRTHPTTLTTDTLVAPAIRPGAESVTSSAAPVLIADSQRQAQNPSRGTPAPASAAAQTGLAMTGALSELSDAQLEALLKEIDGLEAVPVTEPEPPVLPVSTTRPATSRGGA